MNEYTPSTEDVRGSYRLSDLDKEKYFGLDWNQIITIEGFDRWLADHDARILEEAADHMEGFGGAYAIKYLRHRAASLRREA